MEFGPELLENPRAMRSKWMFVGDEDAVLQYIQERLGSQVSIVDVEPPKQGGSTWLQSKRRKSALKSMEETAERLNKGDVLFFGDIMEWAKPDIEDTSFGIRPGLLLEFIDVHLGREDVFVCAFVSPAEKENIPPSFTRVGRFGRMYNLPESISVR